MRKRMLICFFGISLVGMFAGMMLAVSLVDATVTTFGFITTTVCGAVAVHTSNEWYRNYFTENDEQKKRPIGRTLPNRPHSKITN